MLVAAALLALLGGAAPAEAAADPARPAASSVVVLPLMADGTVSAKQARGVSAQLRSAVEVVQTQGFVRLLSASRDDDKQVERCRRDAKCLGELAGLRGADLLLAGLVGPAPDGLRVSVVVAKAGGTEAVRRVEVTLQGNDGDAGRIDRLARSALNPQALRGALMVTGEPGAAVSVDAVAFGELPLAAPIAELVEGDHVVLVHKQGYEDYRRSVGVIHGETVQMKAVQIAASSVVSPSGGPVGTEAGPAIPTDAIVFGSVGAGLIVLGAVAGVLSLVDSLDVEERAQAQQLAFPKDSGLLLRGQIYAWTADGLFLLGAAGVATGAVLWLGATPAPNDDAAAGGAP